MDVKYYVWDAGMTDVALQPSLAAFGLAAVAISKETAGESSTGLRCALLHESGLNDEVRRWFGLEDNLKPQLAIYLHRGRDAACSGRDGGGVATKANWTCQTDLLLHSLPNLHRALSSLATEDDLARLACDSWIAKPAVLLPALSILCQGYLAVHAAPDGNTKGVAQALARMGWVDLCNGGEGQELLADALRKDDTRSRKDRERMRDGVRAANALYWKPLADVENLRDRVTEEWRAVTGNPAAELPGTAKGTSPARSLAWLVNGVAGRTAIGEPGEVAQAYLDLADALEKQS